MDSPLQERKSESKRHSWLLLVARKDYKPGDIIFTETPFAFGEGAEDTECYFRSYKELLEGRYKR